MADKTLRSVVGGGDPGSSPATLIVNAFSDGSFSTVSGINTRTAEVNAKTMLSGSTTAGVLKQVLSVDGAGIIEFASLYTNNATARTARMQVIIDGVTAFDATSNSTSTSGNGFVVVGHASSTAAASGIGRVSFSESLVINIASSLTESDGLVFGVRYQTVAL